MNFKVTNICESKNDLRGKKGWDFTVNI